MARGGEGITLTHRAGERVRVLAQTKVKPLVNAHRLMSPLAAWYVSDILKDAPPPANAKGGRFAYKTGTSYGYRDAWAIGYDGRHVVAVWAGRPDGASVPGMMGRTAAAPILFDAFARIGEKRVPLRSAPANAVQLANADLPPPLKRWREPGDDAPGVPISSSRCSSPSRPTGPKLKPPISTTRPLCSKPRVAHCRSPGSSTARRSPPIRTDAKRSGNRGARASPNCP